MNKTELVAAVAEKSGLSKKNAEAAVDAFVASVKESLAEGEKVQLLGFGSFEVKDVAAKTCINPRTKEKVEVAATKKPVFKAGKALKDIVAE